MPILNPNGVEAQVQLDIERGQLLHAAVYARYLERSGYEEHARRAYRMLAAAGMSIHEWQASPGGTKTPPETRDD